MKSLSFFNSTVECILDTMAPLTKKYLWANDGPFVTRELRKAIMKFSRLKTSLIKCEKVKIGQPTRGKGISVLKLFAKIRNLIILNLIPKQLVTKRSFGKL